MARLIEPELALGFAFEPPPTTFGPRDLALYGLAIGAADDPREARQLRRVYPQHADGISPVPSFFATLALNALLDGMRRGVKMPGLHYGLERVLHAEETFSVEGPYPTSGTLKHEARVTAILDTGRHGRVTTRVVSSEAASGFVMTSDITSIVRSAGGFGGERPAEAPDPVPSDRPADVTTTQATRADQALLFALLGDDNPLHADPHAARALGLKAPILHGMCTLGFATRHLIDALFDGDPSRLGALTVRFVDMVFPGETLVTEMWKLDDGSAAFRVRVPERDRAVLSFGHLSRRAPVVAPIAPSQGAAPEAGRELNHEVDRVLAGVTAHIATRPALARTIGASFQFRLREPEVAFAIDFSQAPGVVKKGLAAADCTLELSTTDFLALSRGAVRGKELYLTGALKMTGRTELAPHLDFLRDAGRLASPVASALSRSLDLEAITRKVRASGARVASARVALSVTGAAGALVVLGPSPDVIAGKPDPSDGPFDATLAMNESAFAALADGTSTLRSLYMHGRVRVDGDVSAARSLDAVLVSASDPPSPRDNEREAT